MNIKDLFKNSEARYIEYSKLLETLYKEKSQYNIEDFNSYRLLLKEWRNIEESYLKKYSLELEYINQGMNPPYCYPY